MNPIRHRNPNIAPLDHNAEATARRVLREAFIAASWTVTCWPEAERAATEVLDTLAGAGIELLKVTWR